MAPDNFKETYPICVSLSTYEGDISNSLNSLDIFVFDKSILKHADKAIQKFYENQIVDLFPNSGLLDLSDLLGSIGKSLYCFGNCTLLKYREKGVLKRISFFPPDYKNIPFYQPFLKLSDDYEFVNITTPDLFVDGFGIPMIYGVLDTYINLSKLFTINTLGNYRIVRRQLAGELGFILSGDNIIDINSYVGEQIARIALDKFKEYILEDIKNSNGLDSIPDVIIPKYPGVK